VKMTRINRFTLGLSTLIRIIASKVKLIELENRR
jgi:hypothetical protein